jgi:uncharacterized lipoprotein YajG
LTNRESGVIFDVWPTLPITKENKMKKIVLLFVAVSAMFVGCQAKVEVKSGSDTVVVDTVNVDTTVVDTLKK